MESKLGWCLVAFATFVVYKAIYNRYFHPLARIPGPFWGSITDLYLVVTITSIPTYGLELHRRYGPVVRIAPNLLSFDDATMLPQVYHRYADKPKFYGSWIFGYIEPMFQSLKYEDHAAKRRVVGQCCSMTAMKTHHESKIGERVDDLCQRITERSCYTSASLDFSEHVRWFLSDTWNHLVYGEPENCVSKAGDVKGLLDDLQGIYGFQATTAVLPWLMPLLRPKWLKDHVWSHTPVFKRINRLFQNFEDKMQYPERSTRIGSDRHFFDGLRMKENLNEYQFDKEDIKAEVITFSAATLDGVAALIAPFVDNILQHPYVYQRLVAEIEEADKRHLLSRPVVSYEETLQLPYFMACIKETLRRDAPAQTILPRIVSQPGYQLNDDIFVPPGTTIGASPYIIHRDASIFGPAPESFQPTRWLVGEGGPGVTQESIQRMERLGMWWGYGDRECIGKHYAQMQCQKLLVELIRRFHFTTDVSSHQKRYEDKRWAVRMFWRQRLFFHERNLPA